MHITFSLIPCAQQPAQDAEVQGGEAAAAVAAAAAAAAAARNAVAAA